MTERCYRVTLFGARRKMTWTPVFAAESDVRGRVLGSRCTW